MLALAYVRRSKNSKKRPSASPERQAANIEEYAAARSWQIEWFRDTEGHRSGLTEHKRPAWLQLKARLESARKGDLVAVVVNSLDRSSRKAKDFLNFLDVLQQRGADFVSVTQPYLDTTTPYGRAMVANMMIFAQLEAEIDSTRLVEDIEYRQSEGQMWGPAPIGYGLAEKVEGSAYKLRHPDQDAPLVRRLLERYAEGTVSMYALAREANLWPAEHIPGGFWRMRRRDGSRVPFTHRSVESILDNAPIYAGKIIRYGGKDGEEAFVGKHEAIVDELLAEKILDVRDRREDKRLTAGRKQDAYVYLLTPILRCAVCGKPMRGQNYGGRHRYWHQANHGWARVDCDQVERELLARFQSIQLPADVADVTEQALRARRQDDPSPNAEHLAGLKAQLEREKDLYALGDRTRVEYLQRKSALERAIVQAEPKEEGAKVAHLVDSFRAFQRILEPTTSPAQRRLQKTMLSTIVESIDVDGQGICSLKLAPWYQALFKEQIILYPQPGFNRQIDLALDARPSADYRVRERCSDRNEAMRELRAAGQTYAAIAERFGISLQRVAQICQG